MSVIHGADAALDLASTDVLEQAADQEQASRPTRQKGPAPTRGAGPFCP